jgi:hypothetical protein
MMDGRYDGEYEWPTRRRGVVGVHADSCGVRDGEPCSCGPLGYRASARDPDDGARIVSPLLHSEAAAGSWLRTRSREDTRPSPSPSASPSPRARPNRRPADATRVADATDDFLAAAAAGDARDPSGRRYSTEALDELRLALNGHVAEELGDLTLASLRRWQVQGFVNELSDSGLSARRLRAIVAGLRAVAQNARERGLIQANPIDGVTLPSEEDREPRTFTTTDQLAAVTPAGGSEVIPDQMLWQLVKVVTIVFVLIALVLAAESI